MLTVNPFRGVVFHWLGGLASGSFYVPYRGVKKWSWEVYWLVGGFFSWIIAPWILALLDTRDLLAVLGEAPFGVLVQAYIFGALWGIGGLTFGLTMRYLGMSLGMGVALGYCAVIGTLVPPIIHHEFAQKVLGTTSGLVIVIGIVVCILGIAIAGLAGMSKEKEMTKEQKTASIKEFNFAKGILVATFSGVFSSCFAMGLDAAAPIAELSASHGTTLLWTGLPKLCVVLLGGFTSNFIWCVILNVKNRTGYQYLGRVSRPSVVPPRDRSGLQGRGARPDAEQLFLLRLGRRDLVFSILFLHDGRDADGPVPILELDHPYGQHHHLQLVVGDRLEGMEGEQPVHEDAAFPGFGDPHPVDRHRGLW